MSIDKIFVIFAPKWPRFPPVEFHQRGRMLPTEKRASGRIVGNPSRAGPYEGLRVLQEPQAGWPIPMQR